MVETLSLRDATALAIKTLTAEGRTMLRRDAISFVVARVPNGIDGKSIGNCVDRALFKATDSGVLERKQVDGQFLYFISNEAALAAKTDDAPFALPGPVQDQIQSELMVTYKCNTMNTDDLPLEITPFIGYTVAGHSEPFSSLEEAKRFVENRKLLEVIDNFLIHNFLADSAIYCSSINTDEVRRILLDWEEFKIKNQAD